MDYKIRWTGYLETDRPKTGVFKSAREQAKAPLEHTDPLFGKMKKEN